MDIFSGQEPSSFSHWDFFLLIFFFPCPHGSTAGEHMEGVVQSRQGRGGHRDLGLPVLSAVELWLRVRDVRGVWGGNNVE